MNKVNGLPIAVLTAAALTLALVLALSCGEDPAAPKRDNPLDPGNPDTGGDPFGLTATADTRGIRLQWVRPEGPEVAGFVVLRRDDGVGPFSEKAVLSESETAWTDSDVEVGIIYAYKVLAVGTDGRRSSSDAVGTVGAGVAPDPDGCIVYEENFDTDPSWLTTWTPGPTEFAHWTRDAYEVRIKDAHDILKYAYSQTFATVGEENYTFGFDFRFTEISWGQPVQVRLTGDWLPGSGDFMLHWDDSYGGGLRIYDKTGMAYTGPRPSLNTWYRIELSHDVTGTGNAAWTVINLDNQTLFWAEEDMPLDINMFNTIAIGVHVWNGEGDHSGIRIDNILLTSGCEEEGGFLAHYPFDGNADDTSGNGRHGIVTGAILTNGRDGSVNGAYRFNGLDTRIDLGFGPGHSYTSLTANLWVRSLAEGIGFGGHDANAFGGVWQAGNFIAVYGASPQTFRILGYGHYNANVGRVVSHVNSGVNLTAGRHDDGLWHMITLVWDGEQATLYIDGQQSHTYTAPGIISPVYNWFVGARDTGGSGWPGAPFSEHAECDIDDLSIWDRALTPQEIADLWDDNSAPVPRP